MTMTLQIIQEVNKMKIKNILILSFLFFMFPFVRTALGTPIYSTASTESIGSFVGDVKYSYGNNIGTLSFELENNTKDGSGFITGLAFLLPNHSIQVTKDEFTDNSFEFLTSPKASPYGDYDSGAAIGGKWTGGGQPIGGIAVGEKATFSFKLTGTGLNNLDITDFTSNNSFAAIRFKGITAGAGSDKHTAGGNGGGAQVPEPATIFLLGSGLLGLFGYRKKFWKPKN